MATRKISAELHDVVLKNKHIASVYFSKDNKYYFNAFTVNEKQKDGSTKPVLYARTKDVTTPVAGQTIGLTTVVGIAETAITETLTREKILAQTPEAPITAAVK